MPTVSDSLAQKIHQVIALLANSSQKYGRQIVFANSLGAEDMVLTHLIATHTPQIPMFVLDTGRLPEETLNLLARVSEHFPNINIQVFYPNQTAIEQYVNEQGINAFYQSQTLRKQCCAIRKLKPLQRALKGQLAWITGLRREQSVTREQLAHSHWDESNGLQKLNPLANWTEKEVWSYLEHFSVPYNRLHDQHYPSIGCAPCSRAIAKGEDIRAGRWWWENPENRECGLHSVSVIKTPG